MAGAALPQARSIPKTPTVAAILASSPINFFQLSLIPCIMHMYWSGFENDIIQIDNALGARAIFFESEDQFLHS